MDGGPQSIEENTRQFCQKVIDHTVESLRSFNGEISDDLLDRIKSQWEQRYKSNLIRHEKEIKDKQNARNMLHNQINEQQSALDMQNVNAMMQQNYGGFYHGQDNRMGGARPMPMGYQYHPPQMQGRGVYPPNFYHQPPQGAPYQGNYQMPQFNGQHGKAPPLGPPRSQQPPFHGQFMPNQPGRMNHGPPLSMTGSMMGPQHSHLQAQQSIISHSSMSNMQRPMYNKTNSIMRGGPDQGGASYAAGLPLNMSRNESIDQIGSSFSRSYHGSQQRPGGPPPGIQNPGQQPQPGFYGQGPHYYQQGRRPGGPPDQQSSYLGRRTFAQADIQPQDDGGADASEEEGSTGQRKPATLGFVPPSSKRARNNDGSDDESENGGNDSDLFESAKEESDEDAQTKKPQEANEEVKPIEGVAVETKQEQGVVVDVEEVDGSGDIVKQETLFNVKNEQTKDKPEDAAKKAELQANDGEASVKKEEQSSLAQVKDGEAESVPNAQPAAVDEKTIQVEGQVQEVSQQVQQLADGNGDTAGDFDKFQDENSSENESSDSSKEEEVGDHYIYAEYVRVNRTRTKFKCEFRNAFVLINGKEYVAKTLLGDFGY